MRRSWLVVAVVLFLVAVLTGVVFAEKYSSREWKKLAGDLKIALKGAETEKIIDDLLKKVSKEDSRRAVDLLIECGLEAADPKLYRKIKHAIGSMTGQKALKTIRKYIRKHRDIRVRIMLIEAVGRKGNEKFIDDIAAVLAGKREKIPLICTAIRALADIGSKKCLDCLIGYLAKVERQRKEVRLMGTDWHECRIALKRITKGETDYGTAAEWKEYARTLPDNWKPAGRKVGGAYLEKDELQTVVLPKKVPKIFGREVCSRTPVFVIDVSGSMTQKDLPTPAGRGTGGKTEPKGVALGRQRVVRAQKELKKLIRALDDGVTFNIIAYGRHVTVWSVGGLRAATHSNKKSAESFVDAFQAVATTHTDEAMEKAWKNIKDGCDTIYLLSDGFPTHTGDHSDTYRLQEEILNFFRGRNRFVKVKVYTLGFKNANKQFMMRLAYENGGRYNDIK